jgi:hypothetical protein
MLLSKVIHQIIDKKTSKLNSLFHSRFFKRNKTADQNQAAIESNETFNDSKDNHQTIENKQTDYRTEYIKVGNDDEQANNQTILTNEEQPLPQENSFACVSVSDFELQTLNATTTSFFSPSMNSLPSVDVQNIRETPKKTMDSKLIGSVLVRAYSQQERDKLASLQ